MVWTDDYKPLFSNVWKCQFYVKEKLTRNQPSSAFGEKRTTQKGRLALFSLSDTACLHKSHSQNGITYTSINQNFAAFKRRYAEKERLFHLNTSLFFCSLCFFKLINGVSFISLCCPSGKNAAHSQCLMAILLICRSKWP